MVILGIDPGSRFLGLGIVGDSGGGLNYLWHDTLNISRVRETKDKLVAVYRSVLKAVEDFHVDVIAVEKAYGGKDYHASELLNQVRGIVMLVAGLSGVDVFEYPPAKVKKIVTGNGRAEKGEVAKILELTFSMEFGKDRYDATDALAIAVCHYYVSRERNRYDRFLEGKSS